MKRNKKKDRQGIRNIRQAKISYDKGLKIFSPYGRLIYTLKPGDSINYNELLEQKRPEYRRYKGDQRYKDKRR